MVATPFAKLEQRVNAAAGARLANAVATFGSSELPVIFDDGASVGSVGIGMATTTPVVQLETSSVPAGVEGTSVSVKGTSYLVAAHEPDGSGWSRLLLEAA